MSSDKLTISATRHRSLSMLREFVIVENIRQFCLLDLTADFGVKVDAYLSAACEEQN